ncbi:hypothetical protein [Clostridium sp. C8]|uniref:Uncharacterized protein n=1 Tax=bioreactor metagenome TaxID=1076179 RepID=A0A645HFH1_9ZZZZ|nr:hypothetical protein [Clostridium sp. C8]
MEYILILLFIIILSIISGKALYNMPNPGKRFYEAVNKNDTKDKKSNNKF